MFEHSYKGKFIVVEGIDGAGSSTQARNIHTFFQTHRIKSHFTSEPTNYLIGGLIRSWLTGDWSSSAMCLQLLFTADRAHHLQKEIIPFLKKGFNVVCDRYSFSTVAYGSLDIPDVKWLQDINKHFIQPDIVFYLRVPAEEAMERMQGSRNSFELFEKEKQLKKVAEQYETFVKELDYFIPIEGTKTKAEVTEGVLNVLKRRFKI